MTIKIPVQADLNTGSVEQQLQAFQQRLNALGQQIAQANKTQFNPISKTSLQDMQRMVQQFEALRRVSGDLNKRINATGQKGKSFVDLDWGALYPDAHSRARQQAKAWQYVTGHAMVPPAAQPGRPGGGQSHGPGWVQQTGANAVQAGLRAASGATGGVGGVAAGALGTGMSAGFGAGMMGLLGGIVALGVGKAVSAVAEHIGKAEQGNIDLDRLKRTLGDVGVSFDQLKAAVHGSANVLGITFDEAGKLAQQFSKLGNLAGEKASSELPGEVSTSVGMARSFGLDPSQTTGVLGTMRGLGINRSEQDTRRFALLIGEAIGKSGAFSKADEVMEAIGNYATMQTRASMGGANVAGYAGLFSGMVGSGIPGLDPSGAGSMLARMNAALSAGGAKGEASQFFSAMVGQRMGLSPLQTQVLREGGMFATGDKMFGSGSAYSRYMGKTGPGGDTTFYDATKRLVEQTYAGDSEDAKLLRAQAFANHTGLNMNQAMAMLSIDSKAMGSLSRFGNIADFNASGIAGIATAMHGSAGERQSLANDLLGRAGRGALSPEDAKALREAMGTDGDALKELLAKLSAKYGQEETTGSIARDSKALLDNIKTNIADKLVPYMNDMREGILYIAGDRKKTGVDVLKEIAEKGSEYRRSQISSQFDTRDKAARRDQLRTQLDSIPHEGRLRDRLRAGVITQEQYDAQMRERIRLETQLDLVSTDILNLTREKEALLAKEVERLKKEQEAIDNSAKARQEINDASMTPPVRGARSGPYRPLDTGSIDEKLADAERRAGLPTGVLRAVMQQETGGRQEFLDDPAKYHYGLDASGRRVAPHTGKVSTAFGPFGILESTGRSPGYGVSPLKDKSLDEQIRFASEYLAARTRSAGSIAGGLAGYGEGFAYSSSVMNKMRTGTKMPDDALSARRIGDQNMNIRGGFDPLAITINYPDGKQAAQPVFLNPYFNRSAPFGQSQ